jgi:hypothetical protein
MGKVDDVSIMKRCFRRTNASHGVRVSNVTVFMLSCPDGVLTDTVSTDMMCAVWAEVVCWPCFRVRLHLRFIGRWCDVCRDPRKLLSSSFVFTIVILMDSSSHTVLLRWRAVTVTYLSFYRKVRYSFTAPLNGSCVLCLLIVVSGRERGQSVIKCSCVRTDAEDCFWVVLRSF